jgi:hypothetical protein
LSEPERSRYRISSAPHPGIALRCGQVKDDQVRLYAGAGIVRILHLAARETEVGVYDALRLLFALDAPITASAVEEIVKSGQVVPPPTDVAIPAVNLSEYDSLLVDSMASGVAIVEVG